MIRLLEAKADGALGFREVGAGSHVPSYAILSHTWGAEGQELTYTDVLQNKNQTSSGYEKIQFCLRQAAIHGLKYCWVDTCCIDKRSSAELTEAITSMFRWYQDAARCYVYLSDVLENPSSDSIPDEAIRRSRWFTRGWTLQELLAPRTVEFFSKGGTWIGDKITLGSLLHEITNIPIKALQNGDLSGFSVDERMSWAASRKTTLEEDAAYCLLGIFNVTVIPAYGERADRAFRRLKAEIQQLSTGNGTSKRDSDDCCRDDHDGQAPATKRRKITGGAALNAQVEEILDSLRFDEMEARRLNIRSAHYRTCEWLLQDIRYIEWLDDQKYHKHNGFLWIKGHPGCGKSTIMKFIHDKAKNQMKDHIRLSFFFNARGGDLEKSIAGVYRTLLVQLLKAVPTLHTIFQELGFTALRIGADHEWGIELLKTLLCEAVGRLENSNVVCFVDALDESRIEEVRDMLSFFESLCQRALSTSSRMRICLASRHYPHITIQKVLSLELDHNDGHKQDIVKYLSSELRIGDDECAQMIRSELLARANGIFMWVYLVVPILNTEYDRGRIQALQKRLEEIPTDLHKLFHDILTRDFDQANQGAELGLCIQWILFSRRPLTLRQLYAAVSCGVEGRAVSETENGSFKMKEKDMRRYLLDISKGLADVTNTLKPTVQFIHESVKDFFLKNNGFRDIWPEYSADFEGLSQERLAGCCLAYVNVDQGHPYKKVAGHQPFFHYAVQNVLYHADQAAKRGISQTEFWHGFTVSRWTAHANELEQYPIRRYTKDVGLEYVLADRNLPNLIKALGQPVAYLRRNHERHRTPLFAALANGHKEAARMFLEIDAANHQSSSRLLQLCSQAFALDSWQGEFKLNSIDRGGCPVVDYLFHLAQRELLEILIELYPEILDADKDRETIFVIAACQGHVKLLTALIDRGIDVDVEVTNWASHCHDMTALQAAARGGHIDAVRTLLANSVSVAREPPYSTTAVMLAIVNGFAEIAEVLIASEIYVNHPSKLQHPLGYASAQGLDQMVTLLIDGGANVNALDYDDCTALQIACIEGHEKVIAVLLERGADPNIAGLCGTLPILGVCKEVMLPEDIMARLLESNASLNALNQHYMKILSDDDVAYILKRVAEACSEQTARALFTQAHRRMVPSRFYKDALQTALERKKIGIVRFVLEQDMIDDVEILEDLLCDAVSSEYGDIVQILVDKFIRTNSLHRVAQIASSRWHTRVERLIASVIKDQAWWGKRLMNEWLGR